MKRKYRIILEVETEESNHANGVCALEELFGDQSLFTGECNVVADGESVNITKVHPAVTFPDPLNP